jgi:hypothetical protein
MSGPKPDALPLGDTPTSKASTKKAYSKSAYLVGFLLILTKLKTHVNPFLKSILFFMGKYSLFYTN